VRLIEKASLGAMLILVAIGSVGVVSASAGTAGMCLGFLEYDKNGKATCNGKFHIDEVVAFKAKASKPKIESSLAETCKESNLELSINLAEELGKEGSLKVTALTFAGECTPCSTVEVTGLPYVQGKFAMPSEAQDDFVLESNAGSITMSGCPFGITCKFSTKKANLKYRAAAANSMTENAFEAEGVKMEVQGSELCGSTASWFAKYVVSTPSEWFFLLR
jgi:hypothetical protein